MIATIKIKDSIFSTNIENLLKIPYFENLLKENSNLTEFELDVDTKFFQKLLNVLRFDKDIDLSDYLDDLIKLGLVDEIKNNENEEIIAVNVGGTLIHVNKDILEKMDFFKSIFSGNWKNEEIFLDMDIGAFRHIIRHLVQPDYMIPPEFHNEIQYLIINSKSNSIELESIEDNQYSSHIINEERADVDLITDKNKYYTSDPQITFFRNHYKRHTPFKSNYNSYNLHISRNFDEKFLFRVPKEMEFPGYFILELRLSDIETINDIESCHKLKWIDNVSSHIIDTIQVYQGDTFITEINGEAIFIENQINNKCLSNENNFNKIFISLDAYFSNKHKGMLNFDKYQIEFAIKLKPLYQLVQTFNGDVLDSSIIKQGKITNVILHAKHYILGTSEINRLKRCNLEYRIKTYFTNIYEITKSDFIEIEIDVNQLINCVGMYIRKKYSLLPVDINSIKHVSICTDNINRCNLDAELMNKFYEMENKEKKNSNILFYHFGIYDFLSDFIDLSQYSSKYIKIPLNRPMENHELVLVYFGEKIVTFADTITIN